MLARSCTELAFTLVHVSSDYVLDGSSRGPYAEHTAPSSPGVFGQSKAASDLAAATVPNHYLVRTRRGIEDGNNFVATMLDLASRMISPLVVTGQYDRLSFAYAVASGTEHLLASGACWEVQTNQRWSNRLPGLTSP